MAIVGVMGGEVAWDPERSSISSSFEGRTSHCALSLFLIMKGWVGGVLLLSLSCNGAVVV